MRRFIPGICAVVFAIAETANSQTPEPATRSPAHTRLLEADSTTLLIVTLKDGSIFSGRVRAVRNDTLIFVSTAGVLTLPLTDVRNATVVRKEDLRNGEYWAPNANKTRLLFGPTGRMLAQDEGYFSVYELFFPGVAYGVSDDFTIGGGMSVIPGLGANQLLYVTPKMGLIRSDYLNVAIGALALRAAGNSGMGGILFGVSTFGGENSSLTTGAGFGFGGGEISDRPLIMIGGEHRVASRIGLVTENYFLSGHNWRLHMVGTRFLGEKMSFDFGALWVDRSYSSGLPVLPYVGLVFNF